MSLGTLGEKGHYVTYTSSVCRPVARCASYVKVADGFRDTGDQGGTEQARSFTSSAPTVTFWRPVAPAGYAVLGHCATIDRQQPAFQVPFVAFIAALLLCVACCLARS